MSGTFRFGIQPLDNWLSGAPSSADDSLTGSIIGPDGCGKSVLALHAASAHAHTVYDAVGERLGAKTLYVSTDFSYHQALKAWREFGLDYPGTRQQVLDSAALIFDPLPTRPQQVGIKLDLQKISPGRQRDTKHNISDIFRTSKTPRVLFIDLQRETAGDDWGFLNHLIGLLPPSPPKKGRHLLIIDAVEGLEAFVGQRDAFGERRTRRSRVAHLIRSCSTANTDVLFVVEESRRGQALPEQFVTDMVLRLRAEFVGEFSIRTLEIEKCRGKAHIRGKHEYFMRSGEGTTTGEIENYDHRPLFWLGDQLDGPLPAFDPETGADRRFLSHFHFIPSLHFISGDIRKQKSPVPVAIGTPTFGLDLLDEQFTSSQPSESQSQEGSLAKNTHNGSLTLLMGDTGTNKSRLANAFLAQCFDSDSDTRGKGVSVLLSTGYVDRGHMCTELRKHLDPHVPEIDASRVFCRRLGVRFLSSSQFLQIVDTYIYLAQRRLFESLTIRFPVRSVAARAAKSSGIRVVIDDWNHLLTTHPNIDHDPLLLPLLVGTIRRHGVTALIVSTQSGQPSVETAALRPQDLRKLDDFQIFTWPVPFFGERRTAITIANPRGVSQAPEIYELRTKSNSTEALHIDRQFALYTGLQTSAPRRVPLVVRLYGGPHTSDEAASDELPYKPSFVKAITRTLKEVFPSGDGRDVVKFEPFSSYDDFFSFADSLDDARLEHTLVIQTDEFWSDDKPSLMEIDEYWKTPVSTAFYDSGSNKVRSRPNEEDQYKVFQPHEVAEVGTEGVPRISAQYADAYVKAQATRGSVPISRKQMFLPDAANGKVDRIPYLWDCGMILARKDLWDRAKAEQVKGSERKKETVRDIWNALCLPDDEIDPLPALPSRRMARASIEWPEFLEACRIVGKTSDVVPFDVDTNTSESLSCLLFEMWASASHRRDEQCPFEALTKRSAAATEGLKKLLTTETLALYNAAEQLLSGCGHLNDDRKQVTRGGARKEFAASREWYSTSSVIMRQHTKEPLCILRLPGRYVARGDWFLTMAKGSRSELLGRQALDMLSSRRMNLLRLHDGLGLPVRDVLPDGHIGEILTALTRFVPETGTSAPILYRDVLWQTAWNKRSKLKWLWRSRLKHYDRDCFYWRRWIARLFAERRKWLPPDFTALESQNRRVEVSGFDNDERFEKFKGLLGVLAAAIHD